MSKGLLGFGKASTGAEDNASLIASNAACSFAPQIQGRFELVSEESGAAMLEYARINF
jgi:hypothetical protein